MYESKTCKDCVHWRPFENNPEKGTCAHPERNDKKSVFYYGYLRADDCCTKLLKKEE